MKAWKVLLVAPPSFASALPSPPTQSIPGPLPQRHRPARRHAGSRRGRRQGERSGLLEVIPLARNRSARSRAGQGRRIHSVAAGGPTAPT